MEFTKNDRFIEVVTRRVNRIIGELELLKNCANKSNYNYSPSEINQMFEEIENKTHEVKEYYISKEQNNFYFIKKILNNMILNVTINRFDETGQINSFYTLSYNPDKYGVMLTYCSDLNGSNSENGFYPSVYIHNLSYKINFRSYCLKEFYDYILEFKNRNNCENRAFEVEESKEIINVRFNDRISDKKFLKLLKRIIPSEDLYSLFCVAQRYLEDD